MKLEVLVTVTNISPNSVIACDAQNWNSYTSTLMKYGNLARQVLQQHCCQVTMTP